MLTADEKSELLAKLKSVVNDLSDERGVPATTWDLWEVVEVLEKIVGCIETKSEFKGPTYRG